MSPYIVPLDLGDVVFDKSTYTYRKGMGERYVSKFIAYYIGGAEAKILVDTGIPGLKRSNDYHPYAMDLRLSSEQTIEAQLSKERVKPEDIDIVILTHLHWDHCFGLEKFTKARFYVSKKEYSFALDPIPPWYAAFEHMALGIKPAFLNTTFTTLNGEKEVASGVLVTPTPGHSPGSQSVVVETEKGPYVLAGDAVMIYENLTGNPKWDPPYVQIGVLTSSVEAWESLGKIDKLVGGDPKRVMPGHDPRVFAKKRYP
jgi:glyoxylase-like metal-dependent hydrolase (beta-lactamase superfamily II)